MNDNVTNGYSGGQIIWIAENGPFLIEKLIKSVHKVTKTN